MLEALTSRVQPVSRRPATGALVALGVIQVACYGLVAGLHLSSGYTLDSGRLFVLPLVAGTLAMVAGFWLAPRAQARAALIIVVGAGALVRLVLVPTTPDLSDDIFRYLWDGRVQADGTDPYRYPPEAEELEHLRDGEVFPQADLEVADTAQADGPQRDQVWPRINRKSEPTIYPGGAQLTFAALHAVGVRTPSTLKGVLVALDLATMLLLVRALRRGGRDPTRVVLYAWNPMVALAVAQSGHIDAAVGLAVVLAVLAWQRNRLAWAGAALGGAAAVKLFPLALAPAFLRRPDPSPGGPADSRTAVRRAGSLLRERSAWSLVAAAVGVLAVTYLPYLVDAGADVLGYLTSGHLSEHGYASDEGYVLASALGVDGLTLALFAAVPIGLWAALSSRAAPAKGAALLGAALLLTTPYPWYAVALVALACIGGAGFSDRRAAELVWPLVAVGLQVAYISGFHDLLLSVGAWQLLTVLAAIVAIVASVVRDRRRPPDTTQHEEPPAVVGTTGAGGR